MFIPPWLSWQPVAISLEEVDLWPFNFAGNNKLYLCLHLKCPYCCPVLTKLGISWQVSIRFPNMIFHANPSSESSWRADGRDEGNRSSLWRCERVKISPFCPHSVFMCFVWIWEQTAVISLYSFNWLVCITETECVYCAVRTGCLYIIQVMCFVWIWEQTAIISLCSINWLVCTTETECVYCAVRTGALYIFQVMCFV